VFKVAIFLMLLLPVQLMALSDPTRPSSYRDVVPAPSLKLNSILWSESRRVAIVNGKAVLEGEQVADAVVVRIERDKVALRRNGKHIELALQRKSIKQEK
jgi:MSHA biogenesis protein MshK